MTPSARIQAVIELLDQVIATPRPADTIASFYFRNRRYIGSKDRAAVASRLYNIMREYYRLGWWVAKAGLEITARNLVIASVMLDDRQDAKTIEELFSGGKFAPEQLTRDERKLVALTAGKELMSPEMPLREKTECPEWAFDMLKASLGSNFEDEMKAMQTQAPLDIRVNTIKAKREEILDQLKKDGMDAHLGKISPLSIRIFNRPPISQHALFREGYFEIQDEGSQMVAVMAQAKPGEQVVDFCAGAGGKTLAMGASMNNKGRIIAMDVLGGRLNRAKERFRRAGLHNIETRELTSERDKYVKRHAGVFDLVLVDAPCSGTGTWRRDPDKRFRQLGPGITSLMPLQQSILDSAYRMVKPGGRLVYATCSLLPEENENQVEQFIAAHPEFTVKPASEIVDFPDAGKYLKLTPAKHDTDGFFAAVLVRKKADG